MLCLLVQLNRCAISCNETVDVDLHPFMPMFLNKTIQPMMNYCFRYNAKEEFNNKNNVAVFIVADIKVNAQYYTYNDQNEVVVDEEVYMNDDTMITQKTRGIVVISSDEQTQTQVQINFGHLGTNNEGEMISLFDSSQSNTLNMYRFTSKLSRNLRRSKVSGSKFTICYMKLFQRDGITNNIKFSNITNIPKSLILYENGNLIPTVDKSSDKHIGFTVSLSDIDKTNTFSVTTIDKNRKFNSPNLIIYSKTRTATFVERKNLSFIIPIAVVAGIYFGFGIIFSIISCVAICKQPNRVFGSGCHIFCFLDRTTKYKEIKYFYYTHPSYWYEDYNCCGCRKCCCKDCHCNIEMYKYRGNCIHQGPYQRSGCCSAILYAIIMILFFPLFTPVIAFHYCIPSERDLEFENEYYDKKLCKREFYPSSLYKHYIEVLGGKTPEHKIYTNSKNGHEISDELWDYYISTMKHKDKPLVKSYNADPKLYANKKPINEPKAEDRNSVPAGFYQTPTHQSNSSYATPTPGAQSYAPPSAIGTFSYTTTPPLGSYSYNEPSTIMSSTPRKYSRAQTPYNPPTPVYGKPDSIEEA